MGGQLPREMWRADWGAYRTCRRPSGADVDGFRAEQRARGGRRAIEEHQRLDLSVRDSQAFVEALINPQPVNGRLRDTVSLWAPTLSSYLGRVTKAGIFRRRAVRARRRRPEFNGPHLSNHEEWPRPAGHG